VPSAGVVSWALVASAAVASAVVASAVPPPPVVVGAGVTPAPSLVGVLVVTSLVEAEDAASPMFSAGVLEGAFPILQPL